jgi:hypothetical protein
LAQYLASLPALLPAPRIAPAVTARSEDAVVHAARREAALALGTWVVAMLYTVTYCYRNGYGRDVDSLTFVLWFPDWVFWGVVVPWGLCIVFSTIFAFRIMGAESLGEDVGDEQALIDEPLDPDGPSGDHHA